MTDAASLPRIIKQAARNGSLDLLRKLRDESCQIVTDLIEREVGHEARIGLRVERHALAGGDAQALELILVGLGDIVSAPFEEGDLVTKDTLLYTMDSSDAQDSMDRAQISVQQAQMSYQQAQEAPGSLRQAPGVQEVQARHPLAPPQPTPMPGKR